MGPNLPTDGWTTIWNWLKSVFTTGSSQGLQDFANPGTGDQSVTGNPATGNAGSGYSSADEVIQALQAGKIDAMEALRILSTYYWWYLKTHPEIMDIISMYAGRENTATATSTEEEFMKNNLLWQALQLEQLGLSNSGVLQTASGVPSVNSASAGFKYNSSAQQFSDLSKLAGNMISMAGRMASSGIYGNALQAVKKTAASASSAAANSARPAISAIHHRKTVSHWDEILDDLDSV